MNFDHYIAVDWSMSTMAIGRMTGRSDRQTINEYPTSIEDFKAYLKSLKGSKILTFEESNNSQWLYVETKALVDKVLVCDPHRNRLLSDGPKSDKIDTSKLLHLLRAKLLKEVFHTTDEIIYARKLVSHYQDVVRMGVMVKNQRSAMFRSYGLNHKKDTFNGDHALEEFVVARLDSQIELYDKSKKEYEEKFKEIAKKHPAVKLLKSIPGVGDIHAVEFLALVIDARRFPSVGHLYSYAGLIRHEKMSGGRYYGDRKPRYSRELKRAIKMATWAAIKEGSDNKLSRYFRYLVGKGLAEHHARHAVSRKIAAYAYGILKSERKLYPTKF
jgi:transposase